ncbi:MAG TPA: NAD(P)-dependent alcohol dehydrogenase [Gaiellaceae bacterium]|nr:NAD(P)-dependent alcohol dehydrogenase [Gaiellaceae bacterium]
MKAIVCSSYGRPEVLELAEVEKPALADDLVLVRVRAASVNPADWYGVAGPLIVRPSTGLFKPRSNRTGIDFAGTVEAVGKNVRHVSNGDDVFGARSGALAEYVTVRDAVVAKPANLTFEEAAAVPVAAITALQGLRDKGQLRAGQQVLINGASGGVGTFAIQIAKALGAEVTAVCSTGNVEQARSLGADHVVDYTREDFTHGDRRYDLLLDVAGGKSWSQLRRVLTQDATVVIVGAQKRRLVGPIGHIVRLRVASLLRGSQKAVFFIAKTNRADMEILRELLETGKVKPVVDRKYELAETADAFRYLGEGHARGKVIVTV